MIREYHPSHGYDESAEALLNIYAVTPLGDIQYIPRRVRYGSTKTCPHHR